MSAAFAVVYIPVVTRLVPAIVSPYAKVDLRRRFAAAGVDAFVALTGVIFWWTLGSMLLLVAAAGYVVLRDGLFAPGQSIGKFMFGLHVIHVRTGRRCTRGRSIARNVIFAVPGLNIVAVILESMTIVRDAQGERLGDRLAETQVVEGFGLRELVHAPQPRRAPYAARIAMLRSDQPRRHAIGEDVIVPSRRH